MFELAALIVFGLVAWGVLRHGPEVITNMTGTVPPDEDAYIRLTAAQKNVDADFMVALRVAENGPACTFRGRNTRGLGIVDKVAFPSAKTFEGQVAIACNTVYNKLRLYESNVGNPYDDAGHYTKSFIRYFSWGGPGYIGYAPLHAENDPLGDNANHFPNLTNAYAKNLGGTPDTILT